MLKTIVLPVLTAGLLLGACSHKQQDMQIRLDAIRIMVKQSALLATQAACTDPQSRPDMILASVTMLRRATGGPEMAKIHEMMGQMPDMAAGSMPVKGTMAGDMKAASSEMQMHVAIHDAGEDVFDLLNALGDAAGPTCRQVQPAQQAAAAALLREQSGAEMEQVQQRLDKNGKAMLQADTPDTVHKLTLALARI